MAFRNLKNTLALCLVFVCSTGAFAQAQDSEETTTDNELWTGFVLKYKLNDTFRVELEQQTRLKNNMSEVKSTFYEFGVRYKVFEYLTLKPQIRYTFPAENRNRIRWSLDASTQYELKKLPLEFSYRARFQNTTVNYTGEQFTFLRHRFGAEYKLYKWMEVYAQYELFYRFNGKNENRVNRYAIGAEFKLNKKVDLDVYYQIDDEINVKVPEQQYILGAKLSIEI